jgi:6-pyruvoyltetrahydropterin/6-carboxytetrahydropterin synthase
VLGDLCNAWKERVLLAAHNPHYQVLRDDGGELEFRLCGQRYLLPRSDVLVLPIDNIAVEPLAAHVADLLLERLASILAPVHVLGVEATVSESPGQGASCYVQLRA